MNSDCKDLIAFIAEWAERSPTPR